MVRSKVKKIIGSMIDNLPFSGSSGIGIEFKPNGELTLGAEIELQLIDPQTLNVTPQAEIMLEKGKNIEKLKPEFYLSTVEINTGICQNVQEVESDLQDTIKKVSALSEQMNLSLASTGCHPFSRYNDCVITPNKRYSELIDRNQWLTRRMTVYGLHVHIGMTSGDDCIRYNNFFLQFLPHILALSASSPFWQGDDTGLASCRPTTYEALPTAGIPYQINNWNDFEYTCQTLEKCKAIYSLKDLWWDMRPSPAYGTLEIRVCDGPATLAEATAVTAFIHLLAHWFRDNGSWLDRVPVPSRWLLRENKWRVMRHGLDAELVANLEGALKPIKDDINEWLDKLKLYTSELGYEPYVQTIKEILEKGNSSVRQREVFKDTNSLEEVVKHNILEFQLGRPLWRSPNTAAKKQNNAA